MATKEILEAIGLGTPFYLAAASYSFFHWLDRNASAQANRAISGWLRLDSYTPSEVRASIVERFDSIYSYPLLRTRAFIRSSIWTCLCSTFFLIYVIIVGIFQSYPDASTFLIEFVWAIPQYIISDYLSLFIVRWWLTRSSRWIIPLLLLGFLGGCIWIVMLAEVIGIPRTSLMPLLPVRSTSCKGAAGARRRWRARIGKLRVGCAGD